MHSLLLLHHLILLLSIIILYEKVISNFIISKKLKILFLYFINIIEALY